MQEGVKAVDGDDLVNLYLNNVWRPNLSISGASGLPQIESAGNVLRPSTSVRCSMRLCPAMDALKAKNIIIEKLTTDVPYNAKVSIVGGH